MENFNESFAKKKILDFLASRIKEEASTAEEYVQEINDETQANEHLAKMSAFKEVELFIENI